MIQQIMKKKNSTQICFFFNPSLKRDTECETSERWRSKMRDCPE